MEKTRKVTIKDVARVAGLSTAAVSRALRPSGDSNIKLQEDTVRHIRAVAEKLNYRPHAGARSIRLKRFGSIGYFVAKQGLYTSTPVGYMAGVHDVAEKQGSRIVVIRLSEDPERLGHSIHSVFQEHNLDALVIESFTGWTQLIQEQLNRVDLPIVYLNHRFESNSVYVDDEYGASLAVRHLAEKGHKRICYLDRRITRTTVPGHVHYSAHARLDGFLNTTAELGLSPKVVTLQLADSIGPDSQISLEQWKEVEGADALVVYDDDLANTVGRFCYSRGIRIPDDLAMVSFNGDYGSLCAWQQLTTVQIPTYEMGNSAANLIFKLLEQPKGTSLDSVILKPVLNVGSTS